MAQGLEKGGLADQLADVSLATVQNKGQRVPNNGIELRHVRDTMADSQDKQKEQVDAKAEAVLNVISSVTKSY